MSQSTLPEYLERDNIYRMSPGDVGYVVGWAICVDEYRWLWIRGDYDVASSPHGTVNVKIERTAEGVNVYANTLEREYELEHRPMDAWLPLPVRLIGE